jgi:ribonuclease J
MQTIKKHAAHAAPARQARTPVRRSARRAAPASAGRVPHAKQQPPAATDRNAVKFVSLGGLEAIGKNMSVFEYQDEILLIDMGLQFPEGDSTPGIDYIIPNVESLMPKRKNIKGIIITHGHLDHIGAIPHLLDKLGASIPIYTTDLTREMIKKRQDDYSFAPKPVIHTIKNGDTVQLSEHIKVHFYDIEHTIPDAIGLVIETPAGNMAYCTDLKIDTDEQGNPKHLESFERMAKHGIHTLFLDSTSAWKPGSSLSEDIVRKNIGDILRAAKGRIIVGLFSSLLTRAGEIVKIAEELDKKVILSGFSLKTNFQIAQNLGYIKVKKGTIIPVEEIHRYKDDKILILSTGAQGEPRASLMKIANGENKHVTVKKGDTIIFSSSIIPGNEMAIQTLKDNLTRQGARVIQTQHIDVHSGGHGPAEDLKTIIRITKPKFFVPIHGMYFMRAANAENAMEMGVPEKNCILTDDGQVLELHPDRIAVTGASVPASYVMVDGLGVGDVEEVVLRDRQALANEGMMVIIATLDRKSGRFLKNPDIISRGFINLKMNKEFVEEIRKKIKTVVSRIPRAQSIETDYLKALIRDQLGQFLYTKTKRRPMVLPVVIEV